MNSKDTALEISEKEPSETDLLNQSQSRSNYVSDEIHSPLYEWRKFAPDGVFEFFRWLASGFSAQAHLTEEEQAENVRLLARLLMLLREYESRFGMPAEGGLSDQLWVLKDLCRRLYGAGTPIWVLGPVMEKAAEGLTGTRGVMFWLLPRSAFIVAPSSGTTIMFRMERGFHMRMMTELERILVRLASFSSNTKTVNSVETRLPSPGQLYGKPRGESINSGRRLSKEHLAREILNLASDGTGLFFFTSAANSAVYRNDEGSSRLHDFWKVDKSTRELFSRLAAMEAEASIDALVSKKELDISYYPWYVLLLSRMVSSAGGTGLWFSGSWADMVVAGCLAAIVAILEHSILFKHERVIFEVIISFVVGFAAALIALEWPNYFCFGAMAVGAVTDILQGFRIVYSIMLLMSKYTVPGSADFMESFLFTGLIASFIKLGQTTAEAMYGAAIKLATEATICYHPIPKIYYLLILPFTTLAWAVLLLPRYSDLLGMALHGILAFGVHYGVQLVSPDQTLVSTFLAAASVTFSAGIVSRFSGRQALGDTVTGLNVLVPGAYLAKGLFEAASAHSISSALFYTIVVNSVVIGLGAWTGTILCSPTILGTNSGQLLYSNSLGNQEGRPSMRRSNSTSSSEQGGVMLFFLER